METVIVSLENARIHREQIEKSRKAMIGFLVAASKKYKRNFVTAFGKEIDKLIVKDFVRLASFEECALLSLKKIAIVVYSVLYPNDISYSQVGSFYKEFGIEQSKNIQDLHNWTR